MSCLGRAQARQLLQQHETDALSVKGEMEAARAQLVQLTSDKAALSLERGRALRALQAANDTIARLRSERNDARAQLARATQEVAQLQQQQQQQSAPPSATEEELTRLRGDADRAGELERQLAASQRALADCRQQLKAATQRLKEQQASHRAGSPPPPPSPHR